MSDTGTRRGLTLIPDDLARAVRAVRLNLAEAARRHGCTRSFVVSVVEGRSSCPQALEKLLRDMVNESLAAVPPAYRHLRKGRR